MVNWMDAHKGGSEVDYRDMTGEMDMYAIQGPNSSAVMNTLLSAPVDGLKRFQVADGKIGDIPVIIHRSGFIGENGFEVYCDMADATESHPAVF